MKLRDISNSSILNDLRDPDFAAGYLEEVLKDGSMESFLLAVRNVAIANGGMKKLAKTTKLGRESMYKTLSKSGNPQFSTVQAMLKQLGLRFSITPEKQSRKAI